MNIYKNMHIFNIQKSTSTREKDIDRCRCISIEKHNLENKYKEVHI